MFLFTFTYYCGQENSLRKNNEVILCKVNYSNDNLCSCKNNVHFGSDTRPFLTFL